jgi:hypothetical protein
MKKVFPLVLVFAMLSIGARQVDQPPEASITNGIINARLYLPDAQNGYYRGSRFDWSGVMPQLEYAGHNYFGQWLDTYSPTLHDAIMGPVEAFAPIGYNEVKAGENFLVLGVGMVTKTDDQAYAFSKYYPVVNSGSWKVKKRADQVEFAQKLDDRAYAYQYKKTVQLVKGKPEMVLLHTLKNTGKKTIETTVYNHNFLVIDKQPVGRGFVMRLPYMPEGEVRTGPEFGKIQGNEVIYLKDLSKNDHLQFLSLTGYSNSAKDYDITIENQNTGAGVRITSDQPLSRLAFWSAHTTICPEPYINIKVEPGKTFSWKIFYKFYTIEKK